MTTFTDDFNRANGPLGNGWSYPAGYATVVSNQASTTSNRFAWRNLGSGSYMSAEADFLWNAAPTLVIGQLLLKCTSDNVSHYRAAFSRAGTGLQVAIAKYVGITPTNIASGSIPGPLPAYVRLRFVYESGALTAYCDGVQVAHGHNSDLAANTYVGFGLGYPTQRMDNFAATDTGAAVLDVTPEPIVELATPQGLSFTGTGTAWTPGRPGVPIFTVDKGTLSDQEITSPTQGTATYTPPQADDNALFTDPSTGETDSVPLSTGFQVSGEPSWPHAGYSDASLWDLGQQLLGSTTWGALGLWLGAMITGGTPNTDPVYKAVTDSSVPGTAAAALNWLAESVDSSFNWANPGGPINPDLFERMGTLNGDINLVADQLGYIRTDSLYTLGSIMDLLDAQFPIDLSAITTQLDEIQTPGNYDLGDILTAISAVRGVGSPTIKTVWDEVLNIRTAENYNLGSVMSAISAHDDNLYAVRQNILDAIDEIGTFDQAAILAAIAGVRGADNVDLTSLHNQTGQLAIDENAHYGQVRTDIAGVRGASNRDLTQVYDKITTVDLSGVLAAISNLDADLATDTGLVRGDVASLRIRLDQQAGYIRTDVRDHDTNLTNARSAILAAIAALPQTQVDLTPVLTAVSNLSTQLTNTRADILAAIGEPLPVELPLWPGQANVVLGAPQIISGDASVAGPMDGLLVELVQAPGPNETWTAGGLTYYKWVGYLAFVTDHGEMEPTQMLGGTKAIYTPKTMLTAGSVVVHCNPSVQASVRTWSRAV